MSETELLYNNYNIPLEVIKNWHNDLKDEIQKEYFQNLIQFLSSDSQKHKIYPPENLIFNAFEQCSFDNVRIVILGQDPYHGMGQANGLCFSVSDDMRFPPSLKNIFKEIEEDIGTAIPQTGNLERWAKQGVLMLNSTLTVRCKHAGSHQKYGWEEFTDTVIKLISDKKENIVFLLWGAYAQKKGAVIDPKKHHILSSAHPSPFSAHRGFFGNKHFSKANKYLEIMNLQPIIW